MTVTQTFDPTNLLTLPAAALKFDLSIDRLRGWRRGGHLVEVGRIPGNARNTGQMLFRVADVERLISEPPKKGRRPSRKQTTEPIG